MPFSLQRILGRRSPKPPAVFFDYDGVIADSLEAYFSEFTRACSLLGFHHLNSSEAFLKLFDGNLIAQLIKAGFPLWKLKSLAEEFAPRIEAANARIRPFDGMPELLARLSAVHPVMIITANTSQTAQAFLDAHELRQVRGVVGSDVETSKVKKIRRARRLFPNCQAYYVGDTRGDMIEARRAGAVPVAVGWGWHDVERLKSGKAVHVAATQAELLTLFGLTSDASRETD